MAFPARHAHVEALLRERKLDRTLTTAIPATIGADQVAPFGVAVLDGRLFASAGEASHASFGGLSPERQSRDGAPGGLPRGQVSELIGPVSSGRTSLAWAWLGAATERGESVALIDTFDRFDPATGEACGIDLARLLWVRGQAITKTAAAVDPAWLPGARAVEGPGTLLERTIDRSLKALNLVLQSGVCTAVVLDFADVPVTGIRRVPHTTWLRLQRVVEGTDVACLLLGAVPLARSAGGVTMTTGVSAVAASAGGSGVLGSSRPEAVTARSRVSSQRADADTTAVTGLPAALPGGARWAGAHDRSRRLAGVRVSTRLSSPRRAVHGTAALDTITRNDAWAVDGG